MKAIRGRKHFKRRMDIIMMLPMLVILSFGIPLSFARFNEIRTGNSAISVAKWDVDIDTTSNTGDLTVVSGTTDQTYTITVTNASEVSTGYSIVLSSVPTGVSVALDGGTPVLESSGAITFSEAGSFLVGSNTTSRTHTLTFSAPLGTAEVTDRSIGMNVVFNQIIS